MPAIRLADIPNAGPQALGPSGNLLSPSAPQLTGAAALDPNALAGAAKQMQLDTYNINAFSGEAAGLSNIGDALGDVSTVGFRFSQKMQDAKDDADNETAKTILYTASQEQQNDQESGKIDPDKWGEIWQKRVEDTTAKLAKIGLSKKGAAAFQPTLERWSELGRVNVGGSANKAKRDGYELAAKQGYLREIAADNPDGAIRVVETFVKNGTLGPERKKEFLDDIAIRSVEIADRHQTNNVNTAINTNWADTQDALKKYLDEKPGKDGRVDGAFGAMPVTKAKRLYSDAQRMGKSIEVENYQSLASAIDAGLPIQTKNGDIVVNDEKKLEQALETVPVRDVAKRESLKRLLSNNVLYDGKTVSELNSKILTYTPEGDDSMEKYSGLMNSVDTQIPKSLRAPLREKLTSIWQQYHKDGSTNPKEKWQNEMIAKVHDLGKNGVLGDMGTEKDANGLYTTDRIKDQTKYDAYWSNSWNIQQQMRDYFADPKNKDVTSEQATGFRNSIIKPLVEEAAKNDFSNKKTPPAIRPNTAIQTGMMGGVNKSDLAKPTPPPPSAKDLIKEGKALKGEGKVTSYNFPNDPYSDSNSRNLIGAWNNKLTKDSLAISPDIERKFKAAGIGKGDAVELTLADGSTVTRFFHDRTMQDEQAIRKFGKPLRGRFDFHSPDGKQAKDGMAVVSFRKANNA
jgi:hypothetical protein